MQSGNRFINYLKKHKVVLIGLILYVVAYMLNNIFPPFVNYGRNNSYMIEWEKEMASGGFLEDYIPEVLSGNHFIELFPLDILYFGVADMAAIVHYGIFIPAALVTYFSYLLQKILEKFMNPVSGKVEKVLTFHFYNNVMFYPLCFLMMFLQNNMYKAEDMLLDFLQGMNQNTVIKLIIGIVVIIVGVAFIIFFCVPMIVNILYFFGYLIVFDIFVDIIEAVDASVVGKYLGDNPGLHEFLSFLVAFIVIGLGNLLLEKILDVTQRFSILPAIKIVKRIRKHHEENE
ncbi:MAG: hypothetical protein IKK33_03980 [Lachnospiraceae bacterium]|nr:hypothetical protein [Lachnospiraceae bacterium]